MGRVADYILRHHPRHVNIFVAADLDDRLRCIMERCGVDKKAARDIIEDSDEQRSDYYNFYSSGTWGSADTYDLCINVSALGLDATVRFISAFVEEKLGIH